MDLHPFSQKRHDWLARAAAEGGDAFAGYLFAIVGDGRDLRRFKRLVVEARFAKRFAFLPWREDMATVYSGIDLLAPLLRFEGIPLVVLDALVYGVSVVASDRDGMVEWLPQKLHFDPDPDAACSLRKAILYVAGDPMVRSEITPIMERVRRLGDAARYAAEWRHSLAPAALVIAVPESSAAAETRKD